MLFHPLDAILSTFNKVRVLRVLVPISRPVSGREAARLAGVSPKALAALDDLVQMGIVIRREATGQHLYSFNHKNYLAKQLKQLFQAEEERIERIFDYLRAAMPSANSQRQSDTILSAVVFGSSARKEAAAGSDLDVLVIVADSQGVEPAYARLVDSSQELWDRFGLRLSPVVMPVDKWQRQIREGDHFAASVRQDAIHIAGRPLAEISDEALPKKIR